MKFKYSPKMKTILLVFGAIVSLAAGHIVFTQDTEGVIEYEVKINMHRMLAEDRQKMKSMVPEFRTSQHQLFFRASESLYKPVEEDVDDDPDFSKEPGRMRFHQPHVEMYFDHATSKRITQQEVMGKEYLIEDSLKLPPWKFGTDIKTVMGFVCRQATYQDVERKQEIVAWYSPELRPYLGPETFNTLPGAILEVDINDGERIITAKHFDKRVLKKHEIKIPHRGTKVTRAEFKRIMEEHAQRGRANGANIIIR
jgi:GLPGLI family protein